MQITGIMIYYYFVCQRKLWYFVNHINMEQNSELVSIGKILDENSYKNEKKSILFAIFLLLLLILFSLLHVILSYFL